MMDSLFPGWRRFAIETAEGVTIAGSVSGAGPALLLLHGHPQTHAIWHKVAPALLQHFTVVACDLRGYGDSSKPAGAPDHANYSKRSMAADMLAVMRHLGFERFAVMAHDRGARVAHRLLVDSPQAVERAVLLDIAPTLAMYEGTTQAFARAYWHWFFLIQPAPLPERLIEADPGAYLRDVMAGAARASRLSIRARWPSTRAAWPCRAPPTESARTTGRRPRSTSNTTASTATTAAWRTRRCWPCGAPMAWWRAASIRCGSGAGWRAGSRAKRYPAAITSRKKRPIRSWPGPSPFC